MSGVSKFERKGKFMSSVLKIFIWAPLLAVMVACANAPGKFDPTSLQPGISIPDGTDVSKWDMDMAIYMSSDAIESSFFSTSAQRRINMGSSMSSGFRDVAVVFMRGVEVSSERSSTPVGLVMSVNPEWDAENVRPGTGRLILNARYKIVDREQNVVVSGTASDSVEYTAISDNHYYNLSVSVAQRVFVDMRAQIQESDFQHLPQYALADIEPKVLADLTKPAQKASGVAVNPMGDILTTYDLASGCLYVEAVTDTTAAEMELLHEDFLVNVSLWKTNAPIENSVVFGDAKFLKLGAPLVGLSHEFNGGDSSDVSLSFANVISLNGHPGSVNSMLLSSAIRPSSSLAGFYDENGALIGFSYSLDYDWLTETDRAQANTLQLSTSDSIEKFLMANNIDYDKSSDAISDIDVTELALNNMIEINCYR